MKRTIQNHLEMYRKSYLVLFIFLTIGVIIGVLGLNNSNKNSKEEITTYLNNAISGVEKGKILYQTLLKNSIWKKSQFMLFLIFVCLSIFGKYASIALVIFKGFAIGYSTSSAIMTFGVGKGIILSLSLTLLTEIVLIPTIFYVIVTSMQMYNACYYQNYDSKKKLVFNYLFKMLCMFGIILFISLMETFININIFLLFRKLF